MLLAGGRGSRMHTDTPKQFVMVHGKPVFIHTLLPFEQHEEIDEIYIVCHSEWMDFVLEMVKKYGIRKFRGTFSAGPERINSLRNGIAGIRATHPDEDMGIITHEAVRPLINREIISENLRVFQAKGNAITATTSNEAYLKSVDGQSATESMPREHFFMAQMPQSFTLKALENLFIEADKKGIDKAQSLFLLYTEVFPQAPLFIAESNLYNIKITHPSDLKIAKALLEENK